MKIFLPLLFFSVSLFSQNLDNVFIHSHNDYHQRRPLFFALESGTKSIEVDVYYVKDEIRVGHTFLEAKKGDTLEELYLQPLNSIFDKEIVTFTNENPLILLIDLKRTSRELINCLNLLLKNYSKFISSYEEDVQNKKKVMVVLSNVNYNEFSLDDKIRFFSIDGRSSNLGNNINNNLMPLISENWSKLFPKKRNGLYSNLEKNKIVLYVNKVHAENKLVRFWNTPENPNFWEFLASCGVDLISTDYPKKAILFLEGIKNDKKNNSDTISSDFTSAFSSSE